MGCSGIPEAAVIMARQSGGFMLMCLPLVGCLGGIIVVARCIGLCPPVISLCEVP